MGERWIEFGVSFSMIQEVEVRLAIRYSMLSIYPKYGANAPNKQSSLQDIELDVPFLDE